jgi:hypothetical protein
MQIMGYCVLAVFGVNFLCSLHLQFACKMLFNVTEKLRFEVPTAVAKKYLLGYYAVWCGSLPAFGEASVNVCQHAITVHKLVLFN